MNGRKAVFLTLLAAIAAALIMRQSKFSNKASETPTTMSDRSALTETRVVEVADQDLSQEQEVDHLATSQQVEPTDIREYREAFGYYSSGGNDVGARHPYEYYDEETLQGLSEQNDGLAQLVLADKLANSEERRAVELYTKAAINGKTAALIHLASGQLVVTPGEKGFGFDLVDESGRISNEYMDVLQFYAAAESLGDFIGTEMLVQHLDSTEFDRSGDSVRRICERGDAIASGIRAARIQKWGKQREQQQAVISIETPSPLCSSQVGERKGE